MKLVSVIIPVHPRHNRCAVLGACIKSIENQSYPKDKIELILIGDECDIVLDRRPEGIKTIIYNFKNRVGPVKTRNKAFDLSAGELLAFIDADCVAQNDWLENLAGGFRDCGIGACAGKILDSNNKNVYEDRLYSDEYFLPFSGLGNAVFLKEALRETGLLDNGLTIYSEEIDLFWRMHLKGYRINYVPSAVVVHKNIRNAKHFFLCGVAVRNLTDKYKKVFNLSPYQELARLGGSKIYPPAAGNRISILDFKIIKYFFIFSGYIYAVLKEKMRISPALERVELTDRFLQSSSSLKPLMIKNGSRPLIKPNYVIWWNTRNGCRILNLRNQMRYELEEISAKIWESAMNEKSKNEIIGRLMDEYEVGEEDLNKDLEGLIEYLCKETLLDFPKNGSC